jgi:hypothetical protein
MTGGRASAVFGEALWRAFVRLTIEPKHLGSNPRTSAGPVTHSFEDPPCRGPEETTLVGSPPVTECLLLPPRTFTGGICEQPTKVSATSSAIGGRGQDNWERTSRMPRGQAEALPSHAFFCYDASVILNFDLKRRKRC